MAYCPFFEIELCRHANIARHEGDQTMHHDPPDFDHLVLIKERDLRDLFSKRSEIAYISRNVLCQAFDIFMRRGDLDQYSLP